MTKRTLPLGALLLTFATAGACLERELRASGRDDAEDWAAFQVQPVPGAAVVNWSPSTSSSADARRQILDALRSSREIELQRADDHLDLAYVTVRSPEALAAVRALPLVTSVQRRYLPRRLAFSCPTGTYDGFQSADPAWQVRSILPAPRFERYVDFVPWHFVDLANPPAPLPFGVLPGFRGHRIPEAWRRSGEAGRGTRIGIVDTGVSSAQRELAATCAGCPGRFAAGASHGRTMAVYNVFDTDLAGDSCGHGTAAASAALAPLDARLRHPYRDGEPRRRREPRTSVVGVAWEADGASARIDEDVWIHVFDVEHAIQGIRRVICGDADRCTPHPRQIVSMAWGDVSEHECLRKEIAHWARAGVLFLGAAGTGVPPLVGCRNFDEALFPAAQTYPAEVDNPVLAVTCVNPNTAQRSDGVCKSYDLAGVWHSELFTKDDWPALGLQTGSLVKFGSSSGCVSTVAGIAALAWATHPTATRTAIVSRLHGAARFGNAETGSGVVDAFLAVGGLGDVRIDGASRIPAGTTYALGHHRTAGDGPFRFEWTDAACDGICDFDRATGTCRGSCPLVGTCAAGHPACESVTLTAPGTIGARQNTRLRVVDEGSVDPSPEIAVRTDDKSVCATVTQCAPQVQCGTVPDGCGGQFSCGTCDAGEVCQDGRCACVGFCP